MEPRGASAYIVAFALLGYRYALRPQLQVVRDQIESPDELIIDRFFLQRGDDMDRRVAAWVEKPRSLESVVVQIDHYLVFLPEMKVSETGICERLATRRAPQAWHAAACLFSQIECVPHF